MMSLEFFFLLVIIGFVIGVGLVVAIARSLNPSVRYGAHTGYEPGDSGLGGWMTLLVLVFFGYFLLQSKCGKDFQEKISDLGIGTELSDQDAGLTMPIPHENLDAEENLYHSNAKALKVTLPNQNLVEDDAEPAFSNDAPEDLQEKEDNYWLEESQTSNIYVQVSAFYNPATAQQEKEIWSEQVGYSVRLGIVPHESPTTFHVLIGPFDSRKQATSFIDRHDIDGFIQDGRTLTLL